MRFTLNHLPISLAHGVPLSISDGTATSFRVLRGRVWVTQEGSLDDVFLDEGAVHTLSSGGRAVITAEGPEREPASIVFDAAVSVRSGGSNGSGWGTTIAA